MAEASHVFAAVFFLLLFFPLGVYHYLGERQVSGLLFPFQTPLGITLLAAAVALAFPSTVPKVARKYSMAIAGALVIAVFFLQVSSLENYLGLWHGLPANFDVDGYGSPPVHAIAGLMTTLWWIGARK